MPLYEGCCPNPKCDLYCIPQEHYYSKTGISTLNPCDECGGETHLLASRFSVVFTGDLSATKYGDKSLESYRAEDGFWATAKNTVDGKPQQVYIDTWKKRKDFMKQEGLVDAGPRVASTDGVSRNEGAGLPGVWV